MDCAVVERTILAMAAPPGRSAAFAPRSFGLGLRRRPSAGVRKPTDSADVAESGAEESRTPDLIIANDALYQLSYRPGIRMSVVPRCAGTDPVPDLGRRPPSARRRRRSPRIGVGGFEPPTF